MDVWKSLTDIFRRVFDNEEIRIGPETTANDIEGWDSLSHVNLILAVETGFRIRFSQKELIKFRNVGDLVKSIESKFS